MEYCFLIVALEPCVACVPGLWGLWGHGGQVGYVGSRCWSQPLGLHSEQKRVDSKAFQRSGYSTKTVG